MAVKIEIMGTIEDNEQRSKVKHFLSLGYTKQAFKHRDKQS